MATGAAGMALPLSGVASASTGDKTFDCGKAYGIISRADWTAKFDVAKPAAVYVNQSYPLALDGSQVVVHSNETSWPVGGGSITGTIKVPMSFGGVPVEFAGAMNTPYSFGAAATVAANATGTWTAPATPGDVPVTMKNFSWATNRNGGYEYKCNGTSPQAPYNVTTMVVKSASRISTDLPAELTVYRGDARTVGAAVQLDGGAVAGTTKLSIAGTDKVVTQSINSTNANASNTLALPTDLDPGEYTVTAEFIPTDAVHYDPKSTTSSLTVLAPEVTATTLSTPSLVFSDDTNAQVTVKVSGPADVLAGSPAGKASLSVDGTALPQATINAAGEATFTLPQLNVGNHTLKAGFVPTNANRFAPSSTADAVLSVKPPAVATTVALALEHEEIQSTAKGLAHISVSAGDKLAVGSIELTVGGETITKALVNGLADIELPSLPANEDGTAKTYEVTARFESGEALNFRDSTATPVTLTVVPPAAATTTTVNLAHASVAPGVANEAEVLVQGGTGIPVGTVNLQVNGVEFNKTLTNGKVTITLPSNLAAGNYPVRASFTSGSPNRYRNSTSEATRFVVTSAPAATTTDLQVDRATAVVGDTVTASVHVNSAVGNPAGTVQFTVDGVDNGAPVALGGSGTASKVLALGTVAREAVVGAVFTPTSDHLGSTAAPQNLVLVAAPVTSAITLGAIAPVKDDEQAIVTATVTQSDGEEPTGEVTFAAGGKSVSVPVAADGTVTGQLPALAAGTYTVTATYEGAGRLAIATPVTLTVTGTTVPPVAAAKATTTKVTATPVQTGRRSQITAVVTQGAAGFVSFNVAGKSGTALVVNGRASVTLPVVAVGIHAVTAQFVPTVPSQFKGSTGTARLVVSKATTRTTAKSTALGKGKVSLAIQVTASAPQRLGGRVQVVITPPKKLKKKVKVKRITATVDGSGVVSRTVRKLKKGKYSVKVTYSGTAQAGPSTVTTKAKVK